MKQQNYSDTIFIKDLLVNCTIGVTESERSNRQPIVINVSLSVNLEKPSQTDNVEDTVSYKKIYDEIIELSEKSSFKLLETLAQHVAELCLHEKKVRQVTVRIEKPERLQSAK